MTSVNYSPLPNPSLGRANEPGASFDAPVPWRSGFPDRDTPRASYAASRTSSSFEDSVATAALEAAGIGAGFITTSADFDWNSIDG